MLDAEQTLRVEAEQRRTAQLRVIVLETGHGEVDGVEIDLRHADLPHDWTPTRYFGRFSIVERDPHLWFPWEPGDPDSLWVRRRKPCRVEVGDRLYVERVVRREFSSSKLSHPADREFAEAYLAVGRPGARKRRVRNPLVFYPRLSLTRSAREGLPNFERLAARACEAMGVADLDSFSVTEDNLTVTEAAFTWIAGLRDDYQRMLDTIERGDEHHYTVTFQLSELVNNAIAAGYFAAQSEAEQFIAPHAHRDINRTAANQEAGRRSGFARRQQASIWKQRASALIANILREPGPHKREAVVFEVQTRWDHPGVRPPSTTSIRTLLRSMEEDGAAVFPA